MTRAPESKLARWIRTQRYWLRRMAQTPKTFSNWPVLLLDMALARHSGGPAELEFRTRSGLVISTPNRPGARVPVYEIFADGSYRLEWFLGSLIDRPIQVIDIGGHVGTFSCRLTQLHPRAYVRAFEPSATTAAYLRRNIAQNNVGARVEVFERALSGNTGVAVFDDNGAGSGLNGLLAAGHSSGNAIEVATVSFDDVVVSVQAPIDLVKIDCEGGEYDLVLGSKPESWASVRRVVIEHHPVAGRTWSELREFFAAVGLDLQQLDEAGVHGCAWLSRDPLPAVPASTPPFRRRAWPGSDRCARTARRTAASGRCDRR